MSAKIYPQKSNLHIINNLLCAPLSHIKKIGLIFGISISSCAFSYDGTFTVDCLGIKEFSCSDLISDVVTPKFTQKYPSTNYQITLIAIQTSNGITASHASVGPRIKSSSGYTVVGTRGWVVTKLAKDLSETSLIKTKLETAREAVQNMMFFCEDTAECIAFNPNP